MKRLFVLSFCLVISVAMLLSACSTPTPSPSTSATPTVSEEKVTLSLLAWNNTDTLKPMLDSFYSAYPNVTIDVQFVPPVEQYIQKFKVLASSGEMTDIFMIAAENRDVVFDSTIAEDLSGLPAVSTISKIANDYYGKDGKVYGLSLDAWIGGIFYNKKLFAEAGIAAAPTTWAELVNDMKLLKDKGIIPIASGKSDVYALVQGLFCADTITQDPTYDSKVNNNELKYADGWTEPFKLWYEDLVKPGLIGQESLGMTSEQATDLFTTEKAAMMMGGPWNIGGFKAANPDLQFDMFPFVGTKGKTISWGAPSPAYAVYSKSPNKAEAIEFLSYIASKDSLNQYYNGLIAAGGGGVLLIDGVDYTLDPVISQFKDKAISGDFYFPQLYWSHSASIYQALLKGCQDLIAGVGKPEDVPLQMDAVKAQLDK